MTQLFLSLNRTQPSIPLTLHFDVRRLSQATKSGFIKSPSKGSWIVLLLVHSSALQTGLSLLLHSSQTFLLTRIPRLSDFSLGQTLKLCAAPASPNPDTNS